MPATARKFTVNIPELDVLRLSRRENETSQLEISVGKAHRGGSIEVSAKIGGVGEGFFTFVMFEDFITVLKSVPAKQVRQKAVDKLFDEVCDDDGLVEHVKQLAIAHYAQKINRRVERDGFVITEEISNFFKENQERQAA